MAPEEPPTARQLILLLRLAVRTGQPLPCPETRAQASRDIIGLLQAAVAETARRTGRELVTDPDA